MDPIEHPPILVFAAVIVYALLLTVESDFLLQQALRSLSREAPRAPVCQQMRFTASGVSSMEQGLLSARCSDLSRAGQHHRPHCRLGASSFQRGLLWSYTFDTARFSFSLRSSLRVIRPRAP